MSDLVNSIKVSLRERDEILSGTIFLRDYIKSWVVVVNAGGNNYEQIRNLNIAKELAKEGHATLLIDLLSKEEEASLENRSNLVLLSERLLIATKWLLGSKYYRDHKAIGYYGANIGAAVAVIRAANSPANISVYAIVSHSGRLDMVDD
ncbi:MAG: hypothetical protein EHM20_17830, partial [Alphaproteobacteria bacterium]